LKAALAVLETVDGLAPEATPGPTDPDEIRADRAKAERDWEQWGDLFAAMPTQLVAPNWTTAKGRENSAR
jgi:hypothetical protein